MNRARHALKWLVFLASLLPIGGGLAQLVVVQDARNRQIFGGGSRTVNVVISNSSDTATSIEARFALVQLSSATAIRLGDSPWKKLELLTGQTVVESANIAFPAVKAETRFLIQWLAGSNQVLGTTDLLVYPTNLLAQIKSLVGDTPVGTFDPAGQLNPLLRGLQIEYQDLVEDGTDKFHGNLAIFGPFESPDQMRGGLGDEIRSLARQGVAVVWLQPPQDPHAPAKPSFYFVRAGDGTVVVAQAEMVLHLGENPVSQLNLIQLSKEALHPEPLDLPALGIQIKKKL